MQQVISKIPINKDNDKTDNKHKALKMFNLWLTEIGKALNTSQLSNYK
jgi:hypothetical protein